MIHSLDESIEGSVFHDKNIDLSVSWYTDNAKFSLDCA